MNVCARLVVWAIGAALLTASISVARGEGPQPDRPPLAVTHLPRRLPRAASNVPTGPILISNRYALRRLTSDLPSGGPSTTSNQTAPTLAPSDAGEVPSKSDDAMDSRDDLLAPDAETPADDKRSAPEAVGNAPDEVPTADEDDLLTDDTETPDAPSSGAAKSADKESPKQGGDADDDGKKTNDSDKDPHAELFSKCRYPSAKECATCHEQIYREWSVSSHAYAGISPMFHKFEQRINELARGTIGHFCMRCHTPVASDMGLPREANVLDTIAAAQEGVTCIACHRVVEQYGRVNGERRLEWGSIYDPMVGAGDGAGLEQVLEHKSHFKVKTSAEEKGPGIAMHARVVQFEQVSSSHFCVSCHQVAVYPGIKLEVVWEQYRASPACRSNIRCQDCHMGTIPGQPAGFTTGPSAVINGKPVQPNRRHSNHMFVGPGYSIAHPGIFPFNTKADRWTPEQWLQFDWRAGWGTDAFEDRLKKAPPSERANSTFPAVWKHVDDRYDAREILAKNLELLDQRDEQRRVLMENASRVEGPYFTAPPEVGERLRFQYRLISQNSGHNTPSGSLGAQPQIWLNVVLTGPCGDRLWESGYVDANGDVGDVHSLEVAAGRMPRDTQLVNFQTKFLTTHVKGTDREMYLPINLDIDQLPFIRPSGFPITTLNHPPFIRMEAHSLPPLATRVARYAVPGNLLQQPGRYRLTVRLRSRAEPIYFMRFCGATPEMERAMNEKMLNFHQHAYEFVVR